MRNTSPQRTNALRLAVLTAVKLMVVFWVVTPSRYKKFRRSILPPSSDLSRSHFDLSKSESLHVKY
jgi:hypothetical protein